MKKILSMLLTIIMCLTCSACLRKKNQTVENADFSRTAGVWLFKGLSEGARLVMDGKGKVTSYYSDEMELEFEGFLGYDEENDTYAIFTDDDEYIGEFEFVSDMQINFIDAGDVRYTKSDEEIKIPELLSSYTPDSDVTVQNISFPADIGEEEIAETYLVRCVGKICDDEFGKISINEAAAYRDKLGYQVYTASWTTADEDWNMFFFSTSTTTYIYSVNAPHGKLSEEELATIFDSLYLE